VVLGVDGSAAPISIPSFDIMRGRSVVGSYFGGIKPKDDIPVLANKCLHKVAAGHHFKSDLIRFYLVWFGLV